MIHRERILAALLFLLLPGLALAQAVRFDSASYTVSGTAPSGSTVPVLAMPGATIAVCQDSLCASRATTYTSASAGTACGTQAQLTPAAGGACTASSDAQGNFGWWILPGSYYYQFTFRGTTYGPYPISLGAQTGCPSGATCDANYNTLALGCTAAGTGTLYVTRAWNATPGQTLGCALQFLGNGLVQPASGATVTVAPSFTCAQTQRCFDLSAGGTIAFSSAPGTLTPLNFGATGNGSTNDTAAIQAAINSASAGQTVYFPPGSYLTDAITMKSSVGLECASGTTFLARSNSESMFNAGSGINSSGLSASGGSGTCYISGNGKTGFTAISVLGGAGSSTKNTYRNLEISGAAIGIETQNAYFGLFENIRVIGPTTGAFQFEVNTTATKCLNCSAIAVAGSPYGFLIHNGGNILFEGTIEGTLVNSVYQVTGVTFHNVYFENTGSTNVYWVQVGTQTGTTTTGVKFSGCTFNVGAQYGIIVEQASGLSVDGSYFGTTVGAFLVDNTGSVNGSKRGMSFTGNSYNVGGAGYDPTKILIYSNAAANDLTNNAGTDSPNPVICSPVKPGTLVTPPDTALKNTQGVSYCDGATGQMNYRYRDNAGVMHQNVLVTDTGLSALSAWPNFIAAETGANNALVATLADVTGTNVAVATGLRITLRASHTLQIGANTLNLNGSGAAPIVQASNIANLTKAMSVGSLLDLMYSAGVWEMMTQ